MLELSPKVASHIASAVYDIRKNSADMILTLPEVDECVDFSRSPSISGTTGGIIHRVMNMRTNLAMVGTGVGKYKGDIIIACRGTNMLRDFITDGSAGLTTSENNQAVHLGFQRTFESMKKDLETTLTPVLSGKFRGKVHCIGHSLGGALASLVGDWVTVRFKKKVYLYTFGAPRVGKWGYANSNTNSLKKIFRCAHNNDIVTMVPVFPFVHAPVNSSTKGKKEYVLSTGFVPSLHAHLMASFPGYLNTANCDSWDGFPTRQNFLVGKKQKLTYATRHQTVFSKLGMEKIQACLCDILDAAKTIPGCAAYIGLAPIQQFTVTSISEYFDNVAKALTEISKHSELRKEDTRGLLGHMLSFVGFAAIEVPRILTLEFIRYVLKTYVGFINKMARRALKLIDF